VSVYVGDKCTLLMEIIIFYEMLSSHSSRSKRGEAML
jgi:hypothetical protein